jgi:ribosomal protein L37AE/L43A
VLCKKLPDLEGIEMKLSELHYIQLLDEARQEILTKGNNTVHYLKEIESRLSAGEEAAKKIVGLEKEVENLQCCGNCKHYTPRGDRTGNKTWPCLRVWSEHSTGITHTPVCPTASLSVVRDATASLKKGLGNE